MVSLQNEFTTNSPARYFTEPTIRNETIDSAPSPPLATISSNAMDDEPILSTEPDNNFRPLRTVPAFSLHLLISSMISLAGIIMAASWSDSKRCEAYFIMLYMRAIFWIITFIFDHYVKHSHEQLRIGGYHQFHRATSQHKSLPLYVVTVWNVTIAAIQTLMQQTYGEHFGEHCVERWLSPVVFVTAFAVVETLVLAGVHGTYIRRVNWFNRTQPLPDALQGQSEGVVRGGSVGQTRPGAEQAELLERQADLINYLRDRNRMLDQKLMQLNAQLRTGGGSLF